jgi:hypothetical protein
LQYPGPNILYVKQPTFEFFPFISFLLRAEGGNVSDSFPAPFAGEGLTKSEFRWILRRLYAKHLFSGVSDDITCPVGTPLKESYFNDLASWAQHILTDSTQPVYRSYPCNALGFQTTLGNIILLTNMANTALSLLAANVRAEVTQLVNMFVWATRLSGPPGVFSLGSVGVSGGNVSSSLGFPTFESLFGWDISQMVSGGFASVAKTPHFDFYVMSSSELAQVNALEPFSVQGSLIGSSSLYPEHPAVGAVLPFDCSL